MTAFVLIWLSYDVFDFCFKGTASGHWVLPGGGPAGLPALQLALIAAEAMLLLGDRPQALALLCCLLRSAQAFFFLPLNDFYYFAIVMLILSQASTDRGDRSPAWVRDVLVWQAAWIYLATGMLKLNPEWLSGGHLFVRFQYLAEVYDWPYPEAFRVWTSTLSHDAWLARCGAGLELLLGFGLALNAPRWLVIPFAASLHLFAAFTVNVWFFGAAMVTQVALARGRK